ncbi:MAG: zinc-binding dehydrogenase, partial [Rhodospirillaceae bacterium]
IEFVGEVVEAGAEARGVKPGDRVMCTGECGWAEYAVADWRRAVPLPANNMTWSQAATLPVALQTMHNAIVTNGGLSAGESILIQGASSGVGLMGLQIARAMGARLVIGSSTNRERRARLTEFGADLAVDSRDESWVQQVLDATGGKGVDLIVDQISGYVASQNLAATAIQGRIVNVGRLGGFTGEFNFDLHAMRRIRYIGVSFRTRSIEEVEEIVRAMKADLWNAVEAGDLALPLDREYALAHAPEAVAYMKANRHFGKVVLTVGD